LANVEIVNTEVESAASELRKVVASHCFVWKTGVRAGVEKDVEIKFKKYFDSL
jgi:hypothetical protein